MRHHQNITTKLFVVLLTCSLIDYLHLHLPTWSFYHCMIERLVENMDAADFFQCLWDQGEQIRENQMQINWLEALLDQLMARLDVMRFIREWFLWWRWAGSQLGWRSFPLSLPHRRHHYRSRHRHGHHSVSVIRLGSYFVLTLLPPLASWRRKRLPLVSQRTPPPPSNTLNFNPPTPNWRRSCHPLSMWKRSPISPQCGRCRTSFWLHSGYRSRETLSA